MPELVQMTAISSSAEMDTKDMLAKAKVCSRNTTARAPMPKRRILLRSSLQNSMLCSYYFKDEKRLKPLLFDVTSTTLDSPETCLYCNFRPIASLVHSGSAMLTQVAS